MYIREVKNRSGSISIQINNRSTNFETVTKGNEPDTVRQKPVPVSTPGVIIQ